MILGKKLISLLPTFSYQQESLLGIQKVKLHVSALKSFQTFKVFLKRIIT